MKASEVFTVPKYESWFVFPAVMVGEYWKNGKGVGIQIVLRWLKGGIVMKWEREGKRDGNG